MGYAIITVTIIISDASILGKIIRNLIKFGYFNGSIFLIMDPGTLMIDSITWAST